MKRPNQTFISSICLCPNCEKSLVWLEEGSACELCNSQFATYRGAPVLLSKDNPLFRSSDYVSDSKIADSDRLSGTSNGSGLNSSDKEMFGHAKTVPAKIRAITSTIKRLTPSKSVNLSRESVFKSLAERYCDQPLSILVVGCGNQTKQLEKHFKNSKATFLFCDIDKSADADIFCDAHNLPFKGGSFDGLITTAVLEHVLYPEKAVSEMVRVLKPDGFIYSEIPFLQSVHEGAYDFTRYTLSGHRRLLENFNEADAGMVAGPATALMWTLCDLPRGLFRSKRLSQITVIFIRYLLFWLKYLDFLMKNNERATDFACATYFLGHKGERPTPPDTIVSKYADCSFSHV